MGIWTSNITCTCGAKQEGLIINSSWSDMYCKVCGNNISQMVRDRVTTLVLEKEDQSKNQGKELGLNNTSGKKDIMRRENFNKLVEEVIDEIRARLLSKGNHYADDDNVFRNFDSAAHKKGITPIQALEGMLVKHQVSIDDIVTGKVSNKRDTVWEKFMDEMCYRILEIGLLRRDEEAPF